MKNKKILNLIKHITLFIIVEIAFVLMIFHEFPSFSIFSIIGIVHVLYLIIVIIAGYIREHVNNYISKFLCTYIPILFHIAGHIFVGFFTIHEEIKNHHQHNLIWTIIGVIIAGIVIFYGEYLLHRKKHCDTYHLSFHNKNCKNKTTD